MFFRFPPNRAYLPHHPAMGAPRDVKESWRCPDSNKLMIDKMRVIVFDKDWDLNYHIWTLMVKWGRKGSRGRLPPVRPGWHIGRNPDDIAGLPLPRRRIERGESQRNWRESWKSWKKSVIVTNRYTCMVPALWGKLIYQTIESQVRGKFLSPLKEGCMSSKYHIFVGHLPPWLVWVGIFWPLLKV